MKISIPDFISIWESEVGHFQFGANNSILRRPNRKLLTYTMHVGRLRVPAGGPRTFLSNGHCFFCILDTKAWKREGEARSGIKETTAMRGSRRSDAAEMQFPSNGLGLFSICEGAVTRSGGNRLRNHCKTNGKLNMGMSSSNDQAADPGRWGSLSLTFILIVHCPSA